MNYKMMLNVLGKTLMIGAGLMICPLLVNFICGEENYLSFIIPMAIMIVLGFGLSFIKPKDKSIYAKEGFALVAIVWLLFSITGALPFVISGAIPNFVDAFFETVSGFTTTGATVLEGVQIDGMAKALTFWRSFTHWIGGMGVLVFVLAILPSNSQGSMHILRAESPGPTVSKLVSKMKFTARILYLIYLGLTIIEFVLLIIGGMGAFDALLHAFSTAGTGGFSTHSESIMFFNSAYIEIVISIFMFLFAVNFNVFYLILIGNVKKAFKSEELRAYAIIVTVATFTIAINLLSQSANFGENLRHAFFQVASISSTTGFVSASFGDWPMLSKVVLMLLMIIGACGGSTGGALKVSRLVILLKSGVAKIKKMGRPRQMINVKFEGEKLSDNTIETTKTFFITYIIMALVATLLLSIDIPDFLANFTSSLSCIGNVGPSFSTVGEVWSGSLMPSFALYSAPSKLLLSFLMLAGRLEIFPILILFSPSTWKKA